MDEAKALIIARMSDQAAAARRASMTYCSVWPLIAKVANAEAVRSKMGWTSAGVSGRMRRGRDEGMGHFLGWDTGLHTNNCGGVRPFPYFSVHLWSQESAARLPELSGCRVPSNSFDFQVSTLRASLGSRLYLAPFERCVWASGLLRTQ